MNPVQLGRCALDHLLCDLNELESIHPFWGEIQSTAQSFFNISIVPNMYFWRAAMTAYASQPAVSYSPVAHQTTGKALGVVSSLSYQYVQPNQHY